MPGIPQYDPNRMFNIDGFFNVEDVVKKLSKMQELKLHQLEDKQKNITNRESMLSTLQGVINTTLQNDLNNINTAFTTNSYQINSSNPNIVTATITNTTNQYPANHEMTVANLATAESQAAGTILSSNNTALNINETMIFNYGSNTLQLIVSPTDTLQNIRDNINTSNLNVGINASIISSNDPDTGNPQYTLVISSQNTGVENAVTITGDSFFNFSDTNVGGQIAANANFTFDNFSVVRPSNNVNDLIDGITFNLLGTTAEDQSVTIGVTENSGQTNGAIVAAINTFFSDYNSFIASIYQFQSKLVENNGNVFGGFTHDETLSLIISNFQEPLFDASVTSTDPDDPDNTITMYLSYFGISTDVQASPNGPPGTLVPIYQIDTEQLNTVISTDFSSLMTLFTDSTTGLITNLNLGISNANTAISGETDMIDTELYHLNKRIETETDKVDHFKLEIHKKFTAINFLIQQFNQTKEFLNQQFKSMREFDNK